VNQGALDDVFAAFMHKEYKDEQIGDLEGDEGIDPLAFIDDDSDRAAKDDDQDDIDYGELTDGDDIIN